MEERRREQRIAVELRVKVSGIDARCETFSERAIATNISGAGALLSHIQAELRCGDLLTIEYQNRRARYRIVWVFEDGLKGSRVAVHREGSRPCPWEAVLAGETVSR